MANYYAHCRTNYFNVKDPVKFRADLLDIPDIGFEQTGNMFMIWGNNPDGAGWPSFLDDDTPEGGVDFDLPEFVSRYLEDNEVAIFMEVGHEKLRYLIGYAVAVNNKGETCDVNLNDIYEKAMDLTETPEHITSAEY